MTMQRTGSDAAPGGRASEAGFAVPTVLMALVAALALGSAAVGASINAQSGTVRDQQSKRAFAAAEAGVANAVLRFNRIPTTGAANACAPLGGTTAGADGWCPTAIGPVAYDRGTYSYRVKVIPAVGTDPARIQVVSTGSVDGTSRRVSILTDTASGGFKPFSGEASIIGLTSIYLHSNSNINAGVATNGDIGIDSNSYINCDYAGVGPGHGVNPANGPVNCDLTEDTVSLPPVNPGAVETENSNARICSLDPCKKATWNETTKELSFNPGGSITLGAPGGVFNYALCKLSQDANSYLNVAAGAEVRIYFLAPESCGGETAPLSLHSNSKIQADTSAGDGAVSLSLLVVGSETIPTTIDLKSNTDLLCSQTFVVYAPRTDIELSSNNDTCGAMAGQSILIKDNVSVDALNLAEDWELPGVQLPPHYGNPHDFVECSAVPTGSDPASGC